MGAGYNYKWLLSCVGFQERLGPSGWHLRPTLSTSWREVHRLPVQPSMPLSHVAISCDLPSSPIGDTVWLSHTWNMARREQNHAFCMHPCSKIYSGEVSASCSNTRQMHAPPILQRCEAEEREVRVSPQWKPLHRKEVSGGDKRCFPLREVPLPRNYKVER